MPPLAAETADAAVLASARRAIRTEREGLDALIGGLDGALGLAFQDAVDTILRATSQQASGRVIVTGLGKSGHVGRKLAATLASTGTPAHFVHPTEASHGDLGMVTGNDVILALSWSGETQELRDIIQHAGRFRVPLIAITASAGSALGRAATTALVLPRAQEACPNGLAPTTSTTMQLALGDALAVALLELRKFTAEHFRVFHPGGKLGAMLAYVRDVMHPAAATPLLPLGSPMSEALLVMSSKSFGCVGITAADGRLAGVITDGDLRRHMGDGLLALRVEDVMTANPRTITPDTLASAALEQLNRHKITALFVVEDQRPVGLIHIHDLLRTGVA